MQRRVALEECSERTLCDPSEGEERQVSVRLHGPSGTPQLCGVPTSPAKAFGVRLVHDAPQGKYRNIGLSVVKTGAGDMPPFHRVQSPISISIRASPCGWGLGQGRGTTSLSWRVTYNLRCHGGREGLLPQDEDAEMAARLLLSVAAHRTRA